MKVFGGLICVNGKQRRTIIKAKTQKRAAELAGISLHEFRNYWCSTGNSTELEAADRHPDETVLVGGDSIGRGAEFVPEDEVKA